MNGGILLKKKLKLYNLYNKKMKPHEEFLEILERNIELNEKETEERRKIVNEFNLKRSQEMPNDNPEEKKKREELFNLRKIEYKKVLQSDIDSEFEDYSKEDYPEENYINYLKETCGLAYSFEDHENQVKKSLKFLKYTFELYLFASYINEGVIRSKDSVCNESFLIQKKHLDLLVLILIKILKMI